MDLHFFLLNENIISPFKTDPLKKKKNYNDILDIQKRNIFYEKYENTLKLEDKVGFTVFIFG